MTRGVAARSPWTSQLDVSRPRRDRSSSTARAWSIPAAGRSNAASPGSARAEPRRRPARPERPASREPGASSSERRHTLRGWAACASSRARWPGDRRRRRLPPEGYARANASSSRSRRSLEPLLSRGSRRASCVRRSAAPRESSGGAPPPASRGAAPGSRTGSDSPARGHRVTSTSSRRGSNAGATDTATSRISSHRPQCGFPDEDEAPQRCSPGLRLGASERRNGPPATTSDDQRAGPAGR